MMRTIYVIQSEAGPVKIGIANKVRRRLTALRTASAALLELAYAAETDTGIEALERRVHSMLAAQRTSGEWFNVSASQAIETVLKAADELGIDLSQLQSVPQKKRGRPKTGRQAHLTTRLPSDVLAAVDACVKAGTAPTRTEAIRLILTEWLQKNQYLPKDHKPTKPPTAKSDTTQ